MNHPRRPSAALLLLACALAACATDSNRSEQTDDTSVPDAALDASATSATETLAGPVTVHRDAHGVAHVIAGNRGDMFFVQGYEMARDRIAFMDYFRRRMRGERAEAYGERFLQDDITSRVLGIREIAERSSDWHRENRPEVYAALASYANGVNAYLADMAGGTNGAARPAELDRIGPGYAPEPWSVADILGVGKLLVFSQSFQGDQELVLFGAQLLMGDRWADILRFEPLFHTHIVETEPSGATDGVAVAKSSPLGGPEPPIPAVTVDDLAPHERVAAARAIFEMADRLASFADRRAFSMTSGSNSWAVASAFTEGGETFLCNDPHMGIQSPTLLYPTHVVDTSRDDIGAFGYTLPGTPVVVFGNNAETAWGITNPYVDLTDLYDETLNSTGDAVRYNGEWVPIERREETILVRPDGGTIEDAEPRVVTVRRVPHHGPIMNDLLPPEVGSLLNAIGIVLSARWPGFTHTTDDAAALLELLDATSLADQEAALARFDAGVMNWQLADSAGRIGYVAAGPFPIRSPSPAEAPPMFPLPGDGQHTWTGFHPYEWVPRIVDPEKGYIVTANNALEDQTLDNDPTNDDRYIGHFQDLGTRAWRLSELLEDMTERGGITLDEMMALQTDNHAVLADVFLPHLLGQRERVCTELSPRACDALDILEEWDRQQRADSAAATLFNVWFSHFLTDTLVDDIIDPLVPLLGRFIVNVGARTTARWLAGDAPESGHDWFDDKDTSDRTETGADMLVGALEGAIAQLEAHFGDESSTNDWRWDAIHVLELDNPAFPDLGLGAFGRDGGLRTINAADFEPTTPDGEAAAFPYTIYESAIFRSCTALSNDGPVVRTAMAGGVSGHADDDLLDNQVQEWLGGGHHDVPLRVADVEAAAVSSITYPAGFPDVAVE